MMKRGLLFLLLLTVMVYGYAGKNSTQPSMAKVYMFGFAESFTDSVALITEVQEVDAYILSNGFLANRSLYSLQLNNHVLTQRHHENMTCAVFYDKSKAKAEKRYQKVYKKNSNKSDFILQVLRFDEFHFETEEWVEEVTTYGNDVPDNQQKKKEKKKKQKK